MSMSGKDTALYGSRKARNLTSGKEISSSTTLSFTSQLSSIISSSASSSSSKPTSRPRPKKQDIFSTHNRNTAKRAKRDLENDSPAFEQKHTTDGETLDRSTWERSKRKMEEKARLYAAMKRGDVEDADEKYAVDFDRKWAEKGTKDEDTDDSDSDASDSGPRELVEYTDEFGRTRTGTAAEAARVKRILAGEADMRSDRFTARPTAPAQVIYGDTIQHQAFNPDAPIAAQMEALAAKRDRSLTPPPDSHFDATKEVRTKGTGFFQFSGDAEERKKQMDNLEAEREETEKRRSEKQVKMDERRKALEERRNQIAAARGKRKADGFLDRLGEEMASAAHTQESTETDMTKSIQTAIEQEEDEEKEP